MFRFTLAVAALLTFQAPMFMDWGKAEDPLGDSQFTEKDGKLTIRVPAGYRDLTALPDYEVNAPRVLRDAEGDFTVEVRVTGVVHADKEKQLKGKTNTFRAGSLLIWADDKNFVRLDRTAMVKDGKSVVGTYFHIFKDGTRPYQNAPLIKDADTVLRIERKGDQITASAIQDKEVLKMPAQKVTLPGKVKVGVGAINAADLPFEVTFDGFSLKK